MLAPHLIATLCGGSSKETRNGGQRLQSKTSAVCLALLARMLVASRLLQRTQISVVSFQPLDAPSGSFQTDVPDRQGPSRDFQIRAALSLCDRGPAKMLAEVLAATVMPTTDVQDDCFVR